ncbi:MAG: hypothetical protein K2Q26_12720 [Bdellovibrionales bacterium]|nr:hypothetical protein [Bdellovibrionales bacterium]
MKIQFYFLIVTLMCGGMAACNFRNDKLKGDGPNVVLNSCEPVLFSQIEGTIFLASNCKGCHGNQFSTYQKIKDQVSLLKEWLPEMPPARPLSAANLRLFDQWVAQNFPQTIEEADLTACEQTAVDTPVDTPMDTPAPEEASPVVETPTPPPAFVCETSYPNVAEKVFKARCTGCHGTKGGINLESYENIKPNLAIIRAVVDADEMPPKTPLAPEQKQLLLKWIDIGAPESADATNCKD